MRNRQQGSPMATAAIPAALTLLHIQCNLWNTLRPGQRALDALIARADKPVSFRNEAAQRLELPRRRRQIESERGLHSTLSSIDAITEQFTLFSFVLVHLQTARLAASSACLCSRGGVSCPRPRPLPWERKLVRRGRGSTASHTDACKSHSLRATRCTHIGPLSNQLGCLNLCKQPAPH